MSSRRRAVTYALLLLWTAVCVLPIYWVAMTSLKSGDNLDRSGGYLPFVDFVPTLDSWRFILFDEADNLLRPFVNSAVIAAAATILTVTVSALAVYGLTRFQPVARLTVVSSGIVAAGLGVTAALLTDPVMWLAVAAVAVASLAAGFALRGRGPVLSHGMVSALLLATRVLPPVVTVIPLYMMAVATGTRDTLPVMILVYAALNIPIAVWLLLPVIGPRASEQEEAARLEGLPHLGILVSILLPMARAGFAAAGLIVFLLCWNEYLYAAYLTTDRATTLPPWVVGQLSMKEAQVGGEAEERAHFSAATILMIVPPLILAAFVQRHLGRSIADR